ncbi:MAG: sugar transferase [Flavobacteriales bacterium]|nr:sugar transferase [Flavobacteriales bacterium]MDW8432283.1 sugar transferase [Flavobacteriales bacterium]
MQRVCMPLRKRFVWALAASDLFAAVLAWATLFLTRKIWAESRLMGIPAPLKSDENFWLGLTITSLGWLFLFYLAGLYQDVVRSARLQALGLNLILGALGSLAVFLILFLDDLVPDYRWYYYHLAVYSGVFITISVCGRFLLLSWVHSLVVSGKLGFDTVLLMPAADASVWQALLQEPPQRDGHLVVGFFSPDNKGLPDGPRWLGPWDGAADYILKNGVEEVILHPDLRLDAEVVRLFPSSVRLRMPPQNQDWLLGSVRQTALFGPLLTDLVPMPMPHWQRVVKRILDLLVASMVLTILGPLMIFLAWLIRRDGHPALYFQERVGRHGKKFRIIKFRTMHPDAEARGPALSRVNDPRVTPIGRFLRKYRLDELPQFINVLKGEMSLVGPRPEREHFIAQIVATAPQYLFLHRVRPGITSWGMVMFGYAASVPEMLQRMRYDILYLENMSLALDFRILVHTVKTVLGGKGQ